MVVLVCRNTLSGVDVFDANLKPLCVAPGILTTSH